MSELHLREEQLTVLKVLYPWYKEEVFRRRELMMRLTAFASAFLVLLLVTMLAVPARPRPDFTTALFAINSRNNAPLLFMASSGPALRNRRS